MAEPLKFIDVNVVAGSDVRPYPYRKDNIEDLPGELERCGIEAAYVAHRHCLTYDVLEGNRELMREISDYPSLRPVWVLVPLATDEFPPVSVMVQAMRDADVRMVRFYPGRHKYSFSDWNLGDWLDVLAEHRIPVQIDWSDFGNWDALHSVISRRPGLPWILSNVGYREERNVVRSMEVLKNLHMDFCWYKVHFGLERLVDRVGHERLLYGSNLTEWSPGPAMAAVARAVLPDEAKAAIAGGNVERLTGAVQW